MKLLTRHTDYAVAALCFLAKQNQPVAVRPLSSELDMPYAFLRGILQKLMRHGILASVKGIDGGYALAVRPKGITLYALMNIFQDTFRKNGCIFKKFPCPRQQHCLMREKLQAIDDVMKSKLRKITIASLM